MNENEIYVLKGNKYDNPLITDIDSKIDERFRDCHENYLNNFKYKCIYDIKLTNINNNETIKLTNSDKSMNLYKLNKKLTVARQNGFIFNQISKLSVKFYSHSQ